MRDSMIFGGESLGQRAECAPPVLAREKMWQKGAKGLIARQNLR